MHNKRLFVCLQEPPQRSLEEYEAEREAARARNAELFAVKIREVGRCALRMVSYAGMMLNSRHPRHLLPGRRL